MVSKLKALLGLRPIAELRKLSPESLLRVSIPLALVICFFCRWEFYGHFIGQFGLLNSSAGDPSHLSALLRTEGVFYFLSSTFFVSALCLIFGLRPRVSSWVALGTYGVVVNVLTNTTFPFYVTFTAEAYLLFPFFFLCLHVSRPERLESWPVTVIICYVVCLYYVPLLARTLHPRGWDDGSILRIILTEFRPASTFVADLLSKFDLRVLSYAVLAIEASSVFLLVPRLRSRTAAILCLFHLAIACSTFLVFHSIAMLSLLLPLAFAKKAS